jgi:tRNA1(Val) A37 N6-methylase TrmN6
VSETIGDDGAIVTDHLLGGRLVLRQPARGHRAGTDAVLLAAATAAETGVLVDAGAGVGTAGLIVALRAPGLSCTLVDKDPFAVALAQENLVLNGLAGRGTAITADFLSAPSRRNAGLADASADHLITNPPFHLAGRTRISPDALKARAHVAAIEAGEKPLVSWLAAANALLVPGGTLVMIHRADCLAAVLAAAEGRFGALAILPVHPRHERPATRILVRGRKGSRAPLRLLPGLVLHEENGRFTALAEAIHRGTALITFD